MAADPVMFGGNIYLLIGLLIALAALVLIVVTLWTSIKLLLWRIAQRRAEDEHRCRKLRPDGTPRVPTARGICDRCGRSFPKVHHLPSGEKLCPKDYAATENQQQSPTTPEGLAESGGPSANPRPPTEPRP